MDHVRSTPAITRAAGDPVYNRRSHLHQCANRGLAYPPFLKGDLDDSGTPTHAVAAHGRAYIVATNLNRSPGYGGYQKARTLRSIGSGSSSGRMRRIASKSAREIKLSPCGVRGRHSFADASSIAPYPAPPEQGSWMEVGVDCTTTAAAAQGPPLPRHRSPVRLDSEGLNHRELILTHVMTRTPPPPRLGFTMLSRFSATPRGTA